jgi:hypothetical protein
MLDGSGAKETGSPTCATVNVGAFSKNPGKIPTRDRSEGNVRTKPKPPGVNGSGKNRRYWEKIGRFPGSMSIVTREQVKYGLNDSQVICDGKSSRPPFHCGREGMKSAVTTSNILTPSTFRMVYVTGSDQASGAKSRTSASVFMCLFCHAIGPPKEKGKTDV